MTTDYRTHTDWIQTFSGKKFFPLEPKIEDICIEDIAHSLANQCRFVGHCKEFYSVAQHSVLMADIYFPFDPSLAIYALLHDASEAYLSDIPRPLKHLSAFNFYKEAEKRLEALIYERFRLSTVEPPQLKTADKEILCEEAGKFMLPLHPDFEDRKSRGLLSKVRGWLPNDAKYFYLRYFYYLFECKPKPLILQRTEIETYQLWEAIKTGSYASV